MEMVPQMDTAENEKALLNRQETLRLLKLKGRERDFLEIGRLLTECKERSYWGALGYADFKDYVQSALATKGMSYSYATRFMKVYRFSNSSEGHSRDLANICFSKLYILVEQERKGEVTPALWDRARTLTFKQLISKLGYKGGEPAPMSDKEASVHTGIKRRIKELGEILGKYAIEEYPSELYNYDVVWKDSEQALGATHVFEIQHRGDLHRAINSLLYAYETLSSPRLFLIVTVPEDGDKARQVVHTTHREMEQNLTVLTREQIERLYNNLSRVQDVMKLMKPLGQKTA